MGRTIRNVFYCESLLYNRSKKRRQRAEHNARRNRWHKAVLRTDFEDEIAAFDWKDQGSLRRRWSFREAPKVFDENTFGTFVKFGYRNSGSYQLVRSKQILRRSQPGAFVGHRCRCLYEDWVHDEVLRAECSTHINRPSSDRGYAECKMLKLCTLLSDLKQFPYTTDLHGCKPSEQHPTVNSECEANDHLIEQCLRALPDAGVVELVRATLEGLPSESALNRRRRDSPVMKSELAHLIRHHVSCHPRGSTMPSSSTEDPCAAEGVEDTHKIKKLSCKAKCISQSAKRRPRLIKSKKRTCDLVSTYYRRPVWKQWEPKKRLPRSKPRHSSFLSSQACYVGPAPWLEDIHVLPEKPNPTNMQKKTSKLVGIYGKLSVTLLSGETLLEDVRFDPNEPITDLRQRMEGGFVLEGSYTFVSASGNQLPCGGAEARQSVALFGIQNGDELTAVRSSEMSSRHWICERLLKGISGPVVVRLPSTASLDRKLRLWPDGACQMLSKTNRFGSYRMHVRDAMKLWDGVFKIGPPEGWSFSEASEAQQLHIKFDWRQCVECDCLPVDRMKQLQRVSQWTEAAVPKKGVFKSLDCLPLVDVNLETTAFQELGDVEELDSRREEEEIGKVLRVFHFSHSDDGGF